MTITKNRLMSQETIKLNDRTTVYLTAAAPSVAQGMSKVGDAVSIHPKRAESLVAAGKATTEAPAGISQTSKNNKK